MFICESRHFGQILRLKMPKSRDCCNPHVGVVMGVILSQLHSQEVVLADESGQNVTCGLQVPGKHY